MPEMTEYAARPISQLELELQAEVDKYVTCLLQTALDVGSSTQLRARLFAEPDYEPDLDEEERERYRAANDNAHRYAAWLEQAYVARRRVPDMLGELRRFYRDGLAAKLARIAANLVATGAARGCRSAASRRGTRPSRGRPAM